MLLDDIIAELESYHNSKNIEGLSRFGINANKAIGINIPTLRKLAKAIGKNQDLALQLWETEIHEARLLAIFIAEHKKFDEALMEKWMKDFSSWDICDQACGGIFDKTPLAYQKAVEWSKRKKEYEKRAGFALMAALAIHDKKTSNKPFISFLTYIEKEAYDDRNFVRKAVNWALRQIGKRNIVLLEQAIECAERIKLQDTKSARWIAADALREFNSEKIVAQVQKKSRNK